MNEKMRKNLEDLKQYYKIKNNKGNNNSIKRFLINKNWYYSWKKYINKDYFDIKEELKQIKKLKKENQKKN